MRSSSPYGRVIDIVVIGLVAALIAIFFMHDGTAIRLLRYARRFPPPWSAEVTPNCFIVRDVTVSSLPTSIL